MSIKKIGIIVADDMEYAPFVPIAEKYGAKADTLLGRQCHRFSLTKGDNKFDVMTVHCGIGKVNAAAATAFAIKEGCDYIINTGLSGGINHIGRGMITLPDRLLEYDFDLTVLGYKFAEKPQQEYIYKADDRLNAIFTELCPDVKIGAMVTGDRFVSDSRLKAELIERFDAVSCDMESAVVASVCHAAGIPFTAVRRISDDAGETAGETYKEMNDLAEATLAEIVMAGLELMIDGDRLF